jgi:hypothetical protein
MTVDQVREQEKTRPELTFRGTAGAIDNRSDR